MNIYRYIYTILVYGIWNESKSSQLVAFSGREWEERERERKLRTGVNQWGIKNSWESQKRNERKRQRDQSTKYTTTTTTIKTTI